MQLVQRPSEGTVHHTHRFLVCILALLSVIGCAGDSTAPASTGTFILREVNGQPLPATVESDPQFNYTLEITAGSIILRPDRSVTLQLSFRDTEGIEVTEYLEETTGPYTRSGDNLTLTFGGETLTARLSADALTISHVAGSHSLIFRRSVLGAIVSK